MLSSYFNMQSSAPRKVPADVYKSFDIISVEFRAHPIERAGVVDNVISATCNNRK
jgi:hypothetical protein